MSNRLATESSPYLRQHAGNPVDWHPWGPEALALARSTDRPILLSIGYAACHWCHVMAHESFEDPVTAAEMNAAFVNVKVDREERPDLDGIYMQAVQAMSGHGGWPMTMFLTPEGVPFFGGTYFPPTDRHGMPSFRRVIASMAEAWRSGREEIGRTAESVRAMYMAEAARRPTGNEPTAETLRAAYRGIARAREPQFEGLGTAPKFPQAMALDFCLRHWARSGEPGALDLVHKTFLAMARGGIYDQVGGGFARYSTDMRWLVPHFEKMLYDNALLTRLGAHLWQATGDAEVRRVTEETLRWVDREMTAPGGGWYSSLDADSEGEEGKFYVWSSHELRGLLGADFETCAQIWGVTDGGNFEGQSILHVADPVVAAAQAPVIERATRLLYEVRAKRVWPGLDDKVLAGWNGLMLRAMADAGRAFGDEARVAAAVRGAEFLAHELIRDGRVMRSWMDGRSRIPGFLEDYASLGLGFIAVYQATFDRRWLDHAQALSTACVQWFWSESDGCFYDTAHDHESLVTRPRDMADNATPAGSSLAAELLLMMSEYCGDGEARRCADQTLAQAAELIPRMPVMLGHLLGACDLAVHGAVEVAIAGDPDSAAVRSLRTAVAAQYLPSLVIAGGTGDAVHAMPLFEGRGLRAATAYVCRGYRCDLPTTEPSVLADQLARAARVG